MKKESEDKSSRIIIILLIAAIVLSVASLVITLANLNSKLVPPSASANVIYKATGDDDSSGRIGITVNKPGVAG